MIFPQSIKYDSPLDEKLFKVSKFPSVQKPLMPKTSGSSIPFEWVARKAPTKVETTINKGIDIIERLATIPNKVDLPTFEVDVNHDIEKAQKSFIEQIKVPLFMLFLGIVVNKFINRKNKR